MSLKKHFSTKKKYYFINLLTELPNASKFNVSVLLQGFMRSTNNEMTKRTFYPQNIPVPHSPSKKEMQGILQPNQPT